MKINNFKDTFLFLVLPIIFFGNCKTNQEVKLNQPATEVATKPNLTPIIEKKKTLITPNISFQLAIENSAAYLPLLQNKRVGVVANQASSFVEKSVDNTGKTEEETIHLVDFLLKNNLTIRKIFTPEHGFRGTNDAGAKVSNEIDVKTGLPLISLYGNNKKPTTAQLVDLDVIIFDLQDVGVRFYTYISTLHYVMEAAAENHLKIIVLDRPNPNGFYIDGPILEADCQSFVGMHPVPIVYGMTIGEYAKMINGEGWLKNGQKADLEVIKLTNYQHDMVYNLPVKPSPNLPNSQSIYLYPSLCLFEGTSVSVARGTDFPFQAYGSPYLTGNFSFTPQSTLGATNPLYNGKLLKGRDLRNYKNHSNQLNLSWLLEAYQEAKTKKVSFWNKDNFINLLVGTKQFKLQVEQGMSEAQIRSTWQSGIEKFKKIRANYLLYP